MDKKNNDTELFDEVELTNNFAEFQAILNTKKMQGEQEMLEFEKELNKETLKHAKKTKDILTLKYKKAKK